ncbi:MAG: cation:proton antiporter [Acidobacteriota bacterium]
MAPSVFDTAAVLMVIAAVFSTLNHRFIRLPFTIGMMLSGLVAAGAMLILDALLPSLGLGDAVRAALAHVDFSASLMRGMLGFLLFAGALHIDLDALLEKKLPVTVLATVGVVLSTVLVGLGSFVLFSATGLPVPLPYCLVFGALISPTDPIAVLGIMKSLGVPRSLEIKVAGESLFNDGVGVVVFSLLVAAAGGNAANHAAGHAGPDLVSVSTVFAQEVLGGIALGLLSGFIVYRAMKRLDEPNLEVFLSFGLVMGIAVTAAHLHTSAPLACVIAGLFIGNHGRRFAMSERTSRALDLVWAFIDHALNAILFLLIGLEVVASVSGTPAHLIAAVLLIGIVLGARLVSVWLPVRLLSWRIRFTPGAVTLLTWGGLKGGISIALALSLPDFPGRPAVVTATSCIVAFSVVVQGLTIGPLIRRIIPGARPA